MFGSPQKKFLKAAAAGDVAELKYCYDYYIPEYLPASVRDKEGNTALHLAAKHGRIEALRFLIEMKADIEASNTIGATPLFVAVSEGKPEAAKVLMAAGADVNAHAPTYSYALHWAAHLGDLDTAKDLISRGALIDPVNTTEERTPLYYAVASNRGAMVQFLLDAGARPDIPGTDGVTPASYARQNKPRIAAMIDAALKAPRKEAPAPAATIAPAAACADSETWKRMGEDKAAHVGVYPDLARKITQVFNFATRERIVITENLKTGAETMGPAEKFDMLSDAAVAQAADAFRQLGGDPADKAAKKSFNL